MKTPKIKSIPWDGELISKPGLYSNVPMNAYHKRICDALSVSSSGLRTLRSKSPAHFFDTWSGNPDFEEPEDKQHFILGRAVHHLFLGEKYFSKLFAAPDKEYPDSKTGEMKPWRYGAKYTDAWREAQEKAGRSILTLDNVANIRGMADAISKNFVVKNGGLTGMIERSIFWKDKATGLWIKVRPDAIPTSSVDFIDLKHTRSTVYTDLQRTIFEYGYHQQGALVRRAAREVLNIQNPTFTLIFVENKRPYCVRDITLRDEDLDRGEEENRQALDTIARCIKSGKWPGPGGDREDAQYMDLSDRARAIIDDRIKFGTNDD